MRACLISLSLMLVCACATATSEGPKGGGQTTEKQKISNITYFDVAWCAAPNPAPPEKLNKEALLGVALFARPQVMECFVDPTHRGPAADSVATVKISVDDSGPKYTVTGTNLTPEGIKCVEGAVGKLPIKPLEKGAPAVEVELPFAHGGAFPTVKMGVNAGSDIAGKLRLAAPQWCECWTNVTNAPPQLMAKITVSPTKDTDLYFEPATGDAKALAECLTPKMKALNLKGEPSQNDLNLSYPVLLVSSLAPQESPDVTPEVQFVQIDAIRALKAADVALKVGVRINAVQTYDGLVTKYKAKPASVPVKTLVEKCAAMVKTDQGWIDSLKSQADLDSHTAQMVAALKAKDARWGDAEALTQKNVTEDQAELTKAEAVKVSDQKVCPKEHY